MNHFDQYKYIYKTSKSLIKIFTDHLSDNAYIHLDYLFSEKRPLNVKSPNRFSEKIQWLKLYGHLEKYAKYTDKLEVRKFIAKNLGQEYLIPLIGIWDNFDEIPFADLPEKFVIKATHGSGYNFICKDKASLDKKYLKKLVTKWQNENFYNLHREPQYKQCKPKIICEKYLEDESGGLIDFKFLCFHGEPRIIEFITDRDNNMTIDFFDCCWNKLPITLTGFKNSAKGIVPPKNLKNMLSISRKLSQRFPLVRVDLYSVKDKIYFGELTFTPGNGIKLGFSRQTDYKLGNLLDLTSYMKNSSAYYPFLSTNGKRKAYRQ